MKKLLLFAIASESRDLGQHLIGAGVRIHF